MAGFAQPPSSPRHHPLWFTLMGATLLAVLILLFWATSVAGALPDQAPDFVRTFTPAYGLRRLAVGLVGAAAVGAVAGLAGFAGWRLALSLAHHRHRRA